MGRLLAFIRANAYHLLFLILEVVALVLLFSNSRYNRSVLLSTAGGVTGRITEMTNALNAYDGVAEENIRLMKRNAHLERELQTLKHKLLRVEADSLSWAKLTHADEPRPFPYDYIVAQVVGNITSGKSNTLTLDIGTQQGVQPDMGVLSTEGVVGVVVAVSEHYSLVLPLVNTNSFLSCKVVGSEHSGTLNWDGSSVEYSTLTNIPKHIVFEKGDSIVTSGYSSIFPKDILVGIIEEKAPSRNDNFYSLRIKLATSFESLKYVYVLRNFEWEERTDLEISYKERE